jgi:hypothetical protein
MIWDQTSCSVASSLFFIAIYLALSVHHRQPPELTHAVIIAMSCSGVVAAVVLGNLTWFSAPEALGVLGSSKPSIFIGTLAMIWVSITSVSSSVLHPRKIASQ